MLRYASRAYNILRSRGPRPLLAHSLKFIAFKLDPEGVPVHILEPKSSPGHLDSIGAVVARTLPDYINPSILIPNENVRTKIKFDKAAVIAHVFYPDILSEILTYLRNIPIPFGLFITTDTDEKRTAILKIISDFELNTVETEVRVTPNRGRDIAPKYIGFRDVYDRYECFLHLHSKKSLHTNGHGNVWRKYLYDNLVGSREIAETNLRILSSGDTGLVYPEHEEQIKELINWGYDFPIARDLLSRTGIELDVNTYLEFPSGSMFWARSSAIKALLDLNLDYSDFPEEDGQIDGTIAHAIERSLLLFVERSGFSWARTTLVETLSNKAERNATHTFTPLLGSEAQIGTLISRGITETSPLTAIRSHSERLRLNLMLPTVNPAAIFGGIDTALKIFFQLQKAEPDTDIRIIVSEEHISATPDSLKEYEIQKIGSERDAKLALVDASDRWCKNLEVRENDIFIATAWWTAVNAFRLHDAQKSMFGSAPKVVYLMQDFEPDFYGWSTRYALAEGTYIRGDDTIAIINSEELLRHFEAKYNHPTKMFIPYSPNAKVDANLTHSAREKIILFYARPSAARNCFEAGIDGLSLWARRNPDQANKWKIYCIGETFDPSLASCLPNYTVTGKMTLEAYASLLSRASVGVSLMVSPHPSYPPLEMAYSGVRTITNKYTGKDLSLRSENITSIEIPTPDLIAAAVEAQVHYAEAEMIGKITTVRNEIRDIPVDAIKFTPEEALRLMKESLPRN